MNSGTTDTMRAALELAAEAAIEPIEIEAGKPIFSLNKAEFVRQFLTHWMYNANNPFMGGTDNAYGSYHFVFQKNITITDISHVEVTSLLKKHTSRVSSQADENFQVNFMSNSQFRDYFEKLVFFDKNNIFRKSKSDINVYIESRIESILNYYRPFFEETIIINFYCTSFNVHIPPSLNVNIDRMVFESGYIHSVGHSIYLRKAQSVRKVSILERLGVFVGLAYRDAPIYFTPYSEEFFDEAEVESPYSTKNGLDGIKISARKHHIGSLSILDFLAEISEEFAGKIYIPKTRNYKIERENSNCESLYSIFLILDSTLTYSKTNRKLMKNEEEQYVICYAQFLKNDNILHIFKERKPGWSGPVTLPHTLSGALANITSGKLDRVHGPLVLDLFCGSGTTIFDYAMRDKTARLVGLDRDPMMPLMVQDNLSFFATDHNDLCNAIGTLLDELSKPAQALNIRQISDQSKLFLNEDASSQAAVNSRQGFVKALCTVLADVMAANKLSDVSQLRYDHVRSKLDRGFDRDFAEQISKWESFDERLFCYICWRALVYGAHRFHTDVHELNNIIMDEMSKFLVELKYFRDSIAQKVKNGSENMIRTSGLFSDHLQVDKNFFSNMMNKVHFGNSVDFRNKIETRSLGEISFFSVENSLQSLKNLRGQFNPNVIITDPPYGFNTEEGGIVELETLFLDVPEMAARILAPRGVLSVVLPASSRNGKEIAYFETKDVFVRQLVDQTRKHQRAIINFAESLPDTTIFPRPPYRWKSERGVSRHILSFMIE